MFPFIQIFKSMNEFRIFPTSAITLWALMVEDSRYSGMSVFSIINANNWTWDDTNNVILTTHKINRKRPIY